MSKKIAAFVAFCLLALNTHVSSLASSITNSEIDLPVPLAEVLSALDASLDESADSLYVEAFSQAVIETRLEDDSGIVLEQAVEYETAIDESYVLHDSFNGVVDQLELPFEEEESAIFRSRLYASLVGKKLVRYFPSESIGAGYQALVVLDPDREILEIHSINTGSHERVFRLVLTDEDGNPIPQEVLSASMSTGTLEVLSEEELDELLAQPDVEVELLSSVTVMEDESTDKPIPGHSDGGETPSIPDDGNVPGDGQDDKPAPDDGNVPDDGQDDKPAPDDGNVPDDGQDDKPAPDDGNPPDDATDDQPASFYLNAKEEDDPGGASDSGGNDNPTPGGNDNPAPGGNDNPAPGGNDNPAPGGDDNPAPGGDDNPAPGDDDNPALGGDDNPAPGGDDNPTPGGDDNPAPGGDDNPAPGGDDEPASGGEDLPPEPEEEPPLEEEEKEPEETDPTTVTTAEGVVVRLADSTADTPLPPNAMAQVDWSIPPGWKTNAIHVRTLVVGGRGGTFTYEITDKDGAYVKSVLKNGETTKTNNGRITVTRDETFTVMGWPTDTFNIRQVDTPAGLEAIRVVLGGRVYDPQEGITNAYGHWGDGITAVFVNAATGTTGMDGDLRVSKSAYALEDEEESLYEIELIASGRSGVSRPTTPVNVLIIADRSLSMSSTLEGRTTRWMAARDAAARIVRETLGEGSHANSRVAVVGFGDGAEVKADWTGKDGADTLAAELAGWSHGSSFYTSWSSGFEQGNKLLASADKNALHYVILISDGQSILSSNTVPALLAANQLNRDNPQARVLTVSIGGGDSSSVLNPSGESRYNDEYASAITGSDILDAFAGFTGIAKQTIEDPVIVDSRSEHVEYLLDESGKPLYNTWYCSEGGDAHVHGPDCSWQPLADGAVTADAHSIQWEIPASGEGASPALEQWDGYRITYTVRVTNESTDYPDTGHSDTGTHSGELGWRSNDTASLLIGGPKGMAVADFPHPVVRAAESPMPPVSLQLVKYGDPAGEGDPEDFVPLEGVRFQFRGTRLAPDIFPDPTDSEGRIALEMTEQGIWWLYETDIGDNPGYQQRTERLAVVTVDENQAVRVTNLAANVTWDAETFTLSVINPPKPLTIVKYGDPTGERDAEEYETLPGVQFELRKIGPGSTIRFDATNAEGRTEKTLSTVGSYRLYETDIGPNAGYQLRREALATVTVARDKSIRVTDTADQVEWDTQARTLQIVNPPTDKPLTIVKYGDPTGERNPATSETLEGVRFELRKTGIGRDIRLDATDAEGRTAKMLTTAGSYRLYETDIGSNPRYQLREEALATVTVGRDKSIQVTPLTDDGVDWDAQSKTLRIFNPALPTATVTVAKYGDKYGNGNPLTREPLQNVRFELRNTETGEASELPLTNRLGTVTQELTGPGSWALYETDIGSNTRYALRTEPLATMTANKDGSLRVGDLAEDVSWNKRTNTLQVINSPAPPNILQIHKFGDPTGERNSEAYETLSGVQFELRKIGLGSTIRFDATDAEGRTEKALSTVGSYRLYETDIGPNTGYQLRREALATVTVARDKTIRVTGMADQVEWDAQAGALQIVNPPTDKPFTIVKYGDSTGERDIEGCEPLEGVRFELRKTGFGRDIRLDATDAEGRAEKALSTAGRYHLYETDIGPNTGYQLREEALATVTVGRDKSIRVTHTSAGVIWNEPEKTLEVFNPAIWSSELRILGVGDPMGEQNPADFIPLQGIAFELTPLHDDATLHPDATDPNGVTIAAFDSPGVWVLSETAHPHVPDFALISDPLATITVDERGAVSVEPTSEAALWEEKFATLTVCHPGKRFTGTTPREIIVEKKLTPGTPASLLRESPATVELRRGEELYAIGTADAPGAFRWIRDDVGWNPTEDGLPPGRYTLIENDPGANLVLDSITMVHAENLGSGGNMVEFLVTGNSHDEPIRITVTNREKEPTEGNLVIEKSLSHNAVVVGNSVTFRYEITGGRQRSAIQTMITLTPQQTTGRATVSGLPLGDRYTVTELPHENYLAVGSGTQVEESLDNNDIVRFVGDNRRTNGKDDNVVIHNRVYGTRTAAFTVRLSNDLGHHHDFSLRDGEETAPIANLLYGVPYKVSEVNIPGGYYLDTVQINGAKASTFTVTATNHDVDVLVTNRATGSSSGRDRHSGGDSGGGRSGWQRDTDPTRGTVITDERVPKTPLPTDSDPDSEWTTSADGNHIPDTGGFPLEAVAVLGLAVIGVGYLIKRRR